MAKVYFTKNLSNSYKTLYQNLETKPRYFDEADRLAEGIVSNKARYESVASLLGVPWYFIAFIHNMESSQNFSTHLHNGDPLSARTKNVPADRPKKGNAPFSWEESAEDALKLRRVKRVKVWSLPRLLYELEAYNGWGYRLYHAHVASPYLWSYSQHYSSGKYIADGTWSDTARSRQCGAAVLLKRLEERGDITLAPASLSTEQFFYSIQKEKGVEALQRFLNQNEGISLRVDGWPGKKTSSAVKALFGCYLKKDPRDVPES